MTPCRLPQIKQLFNVLLFAQHNSQTYQLHFYDLYSIKSIDYDLSNHWHGFCNISLVTAPSSAMQILLTVKRVFNE